MSTDNRHEMPDIVTSDLRWRCRRGMLELDILLNQFLDHAYTATNKEEKNTFDQMLDYPDQLLFDLFLGHMESSDNRVSELVKKIRHTALN